MLAPDAFPILTRLSFSMTPTHVDAEVECSKARATQTSELRVG